MLLFSQEFIMPLRTATVLASSVLAASVAMAGTVDVQFVNTANYANEGNSRADEDQTLLSLAQHLKQLGQRLLPADQVLKIEVEDLVLAGNVRPVHGGQQVRIVRGTADFPQIKLKYTLQASGQPVRSGEEWVKDMNYSRHPSARATDPLHYEKQMLDTWFKERFAPGRPAG